MLCLYRILCLKKIDETNQANNAIQILQYTDR